MRECTEGESMAGIDGELRMNKEAKRRPCAIHVRAVTRHLSLPIQYRVHVHTNQNIFMGEGRRWQKVTTHLSLSLSLSLCGSRNEFQTWCRRAVFLLTVPTAICELEIGGWDSGRKYVLLFTIRESGSRFIAPLIVGPGQGDEPLSLLY